MQTLLCISQEDDGCEPPEVCLALEVFALAKFANPKWQKLAEHRTFQFFFEQESMSAEQYSLLLTQLNGACKKLSHQGRKSLNRVPGNETRNQRFAASPWHELGVREPVAPHLGVFESLIKRRS